MGFLAKKQEAIRPAGLVYAQHRCDGVYRRAGWRDRLQRSRSSESAVTLPESLPTTFVALSVTFPESPVTLNRNAHNSLERATGVVNRGYQSVNEPRLEIAQKLVFQLPWPVNVRTLNRRSRGLSSWPQTQASDGNFVPSPVSIQQNGHVGVYDASGSGRPTWHMGNGHAG